MVWCGAVSVVLKRRQCNQWRCIQLSIRQDAVVCEEVSLCSFVPRSDWLIPFCCISILLKIWLVLSLAPGSAFGTIRRKR